MKSSTTEEFVREFNVLTGSGIGVIMIHTREPHRTQEVLHEISYDKEKPFHVWDVVYGWRIFGETPAEPTQTEPVFDSYKALRRIASLDGGAEAWSEGYFLMHYPHWTLPKHPGFIQCLKHYVRQFAETKQRLVLLVPEGFVPPEELQNDVTIVDFPLPSKSEVRVSLCNIIEAGLPVKFKGKVYSDEQIDSLVSNAQGMTKLESENAFSEAIVANKDTWPNTPFKDFNKILLNCKTDVIKRSEVLELMATTSFDEVGGLDLLKEYISQRTRAFTQEARDFGVDVPKGIMLIGSPGCGKSLCAKAMSATLGLPLIKFDVSSVYGSLVGQSEQRVKAALSQLDACAPCVVGDTQITLGSGGQAATAEELYLGKVCPDKVPTVSDSGVRTATSALGIVRKPIANKKLLTITDEKDNFITVTDNHKLLTENSDGTLQWKEAKDIKAGDLLVRGV